jgi:hypothetical protein
VALFFLISVVTLQVASSQQGFDLRVISSRPDTVSGGDVLVRLNTPSQSHWTAHLNGTDVTGSFRPAAKTGASIALLSGLTLGKNTLAILVDGSTKAQLEITNYPSSGPIFSGPHEVPFVCQTEDSGLGPALDSDCYANTIIQYYYKSTEQPDAFTAMTAKTGPGHLDLGFKEYDPNGPLPSDVAQTTTSDGRTVPYIVRREFGVINRAVYDIEFLHRPGDPLPDPWNQADAGWNGRLVYEFKSGCGSGFHQGSLGDPIGAWQERLLSHGFAIATSTLNDFGNDCNDRISAETLSMVKEYFIKHFGVPVHTIGWGGSGGAMEVYLIAQNYPGLLDGIIPMATFADVTTYIQGGMDCVLLDHSLKASKVPWTEPQKTAISGFGTWAHCEIFPKYNLVYSDPKLCTTEGADHALPADTLYDRSTNPKGVRCDLYSNEINVFGRDPHTGFARQPLDNVGVQYGLTAFNAGKITAEQFVELNENAGGLDTDANIIPSRTEGDPETMRMAYDRGLVMTGGGGLNDIPIIDWRGYSDTFGSADGHVRYRSFSARARLIEANGNADNQVMFVDTEAAWFDWSKGIWGPIGDLSVEMDRWLDKIAADHAPGTAAEKVRRDRPKDVADGCRTIDGQIVSERATYRVPGRCNQLYPAYGNARTAAGASIADNVLKCSLKPLNRADYPKSLTDAQFKRLQAVYPTGVCDFSRPGVGQHVTKTTWQRF